MTPDPFGMYTEFAKSNLCIEPDSNYSFFDCEELISSVIESFKYVQT